MTVRCGNGWINLCRGRVTATAETALACKTEATALCKADKKQSAKRKKGKVYNG